MDRDRRVWWGKYLREIADKLELRDWTIATGVRPCADGANAEVIRTYGKKYATVLFCVGWDERSLEDNRLTCVHELLHCHFYKTSQVIEDARENIGKDWLSLLQANCYLEEEYIVSALADVIAKFLPLPCLDPIDPSVPRELRSDDV